ncbi:hypothetical protein BJ138DRAFT_1020371 [Hygrophoropsis aurantiaca]|uniref:Uncharacterized protein n=1 Tax=Hygrophoropsis aurantiaca TaxID=72124 RepID=A0ACB7ZRW5_9AGAM|nr:hypothetical protein BJ138DRAFT_1020371 [Hygrophoropsis aurantiaca]
MTGLFQPCDVGIQRPLKHSLKCSAHGDVVQEVLEQLEKGIPSSDVTIDTRLKTLRDRTVNWSWKAWNALNKRIPVIESCNSPKTTPGSFDLSYESLTSREAREVLRELPQTDPEFFKELTQSRRGPKPNLTTDEERLADSENDTQGEGISDDSEVPLSVVMQYVGEQETLVVESTYKCDEDGQLLSTAESEETVMETSTAGDTDALNPSEKAPPKEEMGRGKRRKLGNSHYADVAFRWWE